MPMTYLGPREHYLVDLDWPHRVRAANYAEKSRYCTEKTQAPGSSCKGWSGNFSKSGLEKPLVGAVWASKSHLWTSARQALWLQCAVPYSVLGSFKDIGSEIEEELLNFCIVLKKPLSRTKLPDFWRQKATFRTKKSRFFGLKKPLFRTILCRSFPGPEDSEGKHGKAPSPFQFCATVACSPFWLLKKAFGQSRETFSDAEISFGSLVMGGQFIGEIVTGAKRLQICELQETVIEIGPWVAARPEASLHVSTKLSCRPGRCLLSCLQESPGTSSTKTCTSLRPSQKRNVSVETFDPA
ncbi:hypothetical protein B0H14DRAFT_2574564 [Mycena olivaceomarginata]|nr:hypothetical protein B0H14DRAFT_2574564 [Mycena olivaceomarginata]